MGFLLTAATLGTWLDQTFAGFDMSVFRFFGNIHNDILTVISQIFTTMGTPVYIGLFAVFAVILVFFRRTRKYGIALLAAIAIGTILVNLICKPLFLRIRPYNTLQNVADYFGWYKLSGMLAESDYSFPSGHTNGAMEIAMALCLCFASDRKWKIFWIPPVVAILVGFSRVYLMVHYATDVIAGYLFGCIAGILGFIIAKLITKQLERHAAKKAVQKGRPAGKRRVLSSGQLAVTCILAWLVIFTAAFIPEISGASSPKQRCAYDGDYKCYNEAQVDNSKYPAINGEYYCKIHWKELNQ